MRLGAVSGPRTGRIVEIAHRLTMGRSPDCALVLADPKVSRRHATVWRHGGGLMVRDDGSLNGTWLNGVRIRMAMSLTLGDRLRVGSSEFVVCDDHDPIDGDRREATAVADHREHTLLQVGAPR